MVTAKDLSKAKAKKLKKLSGLMSLGTLGGKNILLIVRNKAPKKVSKESYAAAIANAVGLLQSGKAKKRIKAAWGGYAPASASAAFKKVNVKLHKAAIN